MRLQRLPSRTLGRFPRTHTSPRSLRRSVLYALGAGPASSKPSASSSGMTKETSFRRKTRTLMGKQVGLVVFDRATGFTNCYPAGAKSARKTEEAFVHWQGQQRVQLFYSDNAPELRKVAARMR